MSEQPETESLSIADRLAAQFEPELNEQPEHEETPEQPEQEAAPESDAQPEFVEVEYEGKAYQVPPELKDALMAQSDYTKKTTEVSERMRVAEQKELQHRAFEAERAFHQKARDDIKAIDQIDFQIEQWKKVDVSALDAKQLWQVKAQIDELKDQREKLTNGLNTKWQEFQQEQTRLVQEARTKAEEHIAKKLKGWTAETKKSLREYALSEGYTAPEVDTINDPRLITLLWKSQQFDKLQAQASKGKVTTVPTVKPGSSNPMPQHVKDSLAYRKQISKPGMSDSQKAKVIERELMNRF